MVKCRTGEREIPGSIPGRYNFLFVCFFSFCCCFFVFCLFVFCVLFFFFIFFFVVVVFCFLYCFVFLFFSFLGWFDKKAKSNGIPSYLPICHR